jgi:hypothetical protein
MIPGLYYYENVLEESEGMLQQLNMYRWETSGTTKYQRYKPNLLGYNTLPTCLKPLRDQVTEICRMILPTKTPNYAYFNECLIVQYEIGEGMAKHYAYPRDDCDVAATFVFGGGATLLFSNKDTVKELYTRHHSLCIVSEDAAWDWTSEMPVALYDTVKDEKVFRERRIAITFRHI